MIGRRADALFTPEDRAADLLATELTKTREEARSIDERYFQRKDGSRFFASAVTMKLGEVEFGFATIARDLSTQKGASDVIRKIVAAQEEERARIARDLHDQLGQQLTALRLSLQRHRGDVEGARRHEDLERAIALAAEIDGEVDFLAWELRPAVLDDLGLTVALPRFVHEWAEHYGVPADFVGGMAPGQLSRDAEIVFYRVAQEALNNIAKHAHATRVDVLLEQRDGAAIMVIEDDGVGFDGGDTAQPQAGIGLVGMRERAALIGALLQIESTSGGGTSVYLRYPLQGA
jgi:signal transduction histidine kinase